MSSIHRQDIGIIILAAGSSQRFDGDKRKALLKNGKGLLESTLENIPETFTKKLLVLHEGDEELASSFNEQWQIYIAINSQQGMGTSLSSAIANMDGWSGVLIGLGDMPYIKPETYSALQISLCSHKIVTPLFNGLRGNPVGFQADFFSELQALHGDQGARSLLKRYSSMCYQYPTDDEGILKDIDTKKALKERA